MRLLRYDIQHNVDGTFTADIFDDNGNFVWFENFQTEAGARAWAYNFCLNN